ncbi:methyltransferase domain-containing protein [Synechococcus sp. PCC 7336]|uniref:methyltransferase domain-containing protein n=1 Tax=Synechococcus sp. PCC 7336 TaxID=195250 RepID=UPI00138ADCBE|nr:methyltransferase domain-containing protein [Synechococcus sp. PCC 7336]
MLQSNISVLDIGGSNVNGSYRDVFSDEKFKYLAVDLEAAPGVDIVLDNPYKLPFKDAEFDIIISGQVFEHVEFFWKLFEEMARVLQRDGLMFLIVPSAGPIHRYPVDCYRFYPDSMQALARYAGIKLNACWMDDRGPWNDLVSVFAHRETATPVPINVILPGNKYTEQTAVAPLFDSGIDPTVELTRGKVPYLDVLRTIHKIVEPRNYFEIGVRRGNSLSLASCPSIAVDPDPDLNFSLAKHQVLYRKTSDAFFREDATEAMTDRAWDLAFIDGMHLFEFALRDFINVERYATSTTLVAIDDIYPNHPLQAKRMRQSRVWTGDVWKLRYCLEQFRPDLVLLPIDTAPTGILLVAGLNPKNRTLSNKYNPIVRKYRSLSLDECDLPILDRGDALSPEDGRIEELLDVLAKERQNSQRNLSVRLKRLLNPRHANDY